MKAKHRLLISLGSIAGGTLGLFILLFSLPAVLTTATIVLLFLSIIPLAMAWTFGAIAGAKALYDLDVNKDDGCFFPRSKPSAELKDEASGQQFEMTQLLPVSRSVYVHSPEVKHTEKNERSCLGSLCFFLPSRVKALISCEDSPANDTISRP